MCSPYFQVFFPPKDVWVHMSTVMALQVLMTIMGRGRFREIADLTKVATGPSQQKEQPNAFSY